MSTVDSSTHLVLHYGIADVIAQSVSDTRQSNISYFTMLADLVKEKKLTHVQHNSITRVLYPTPFIH
jgi:hypothetical protein